MALTSLTEKAWTLGRGTAAGWRLPPMATRPRLRSIITFTSWWKRDTPATRWVKLTRMPPRPVSWTSLSSAVESAAGVRP